MKHIIQFCSKQLPRYWRRAINYPKQVILPRTGNNYPIKGAKLPATEIYSHHEANAANGEELPQHCRVPVDSKRGGNPSFTTPTEGNCQSRD